MGDPSQYPIVSSKDGGGGVTLGEVVRAVAPLIDAGDVKAFSDKLDELFLGGSWGHVFDLLKVRGYDWPSFARDIRGLVWDAYRAGARLGAYEDLDTKKRKST